MDLDKTLVSNLQASLLTENHINLYYEYTEILKKLGRHEGVKMVFFIYSTVDYIPDNYHHLINIFGEEKYMYTTQYAIIANGNYSLKINTGKSADNYIYIQFADDTLYSARYDTTLKINPNMYKNISLINSFITELSTLSIDTINIKLQSICDHVTWNDPIWPKYTTCNICQTFMTICLHVHDKSICLNCINPQCLVTVQACILNKCQPMCFIFCGICQTIHMCMKKQIVHETCPYCAEVNSKLVYSDKFLYCGRCGGIST